MSLTDQQFREEHKPVHVPSAYKNADTLTDKVVFALADIGEGTVEQVIQHLEELEPEADTKLLIADTHRILTEFYEKGAIGAVKQDGGFVYNLHKITKANDGAVDPGNLAPGLD